MGLTGLVIGFAVILIVLVILFPFFSDSFSNAVDAFDTKLEANAIGNKPITGSTVCDLKFTVYGELDFANQDARTVLIPNPLETNLVLFMNKKTSHPEIAQYQWLNCYQKGGTLSLNSLFGGLTGLDLLADEQKQVKLDVTGTALGDSFTFKISGANKNGELLIDKLGRTSWEKRVVIEDWSQIKIPYGVSARFTLDDVVRDNYTVEINAVGKSINNMPSNEPYIYHILK